MASPSASLTLGLHYHRAGRLAEAEGLYREVLAAEPENADALHLFGVLAHQVGQHGVAVEAISLAIHYAPERADFHSNLGDVLRALQLYPEAFETLSRAIVLDPKAAAAHNNLGLVLQALGRIDEAADFYRRALELEPHFPEAHNNLGNAWKELRQPERAEACYRKALALRPGYPEALHNLGNLMKEVGRREEAAFAAEGLAAASYCVFLPRLSPERFLAVGAVCDVFLDSIGWSGFNSTLEASVNDLPVVTLPGELMRGRHSMAVLRAMGVGETIASSLDDYVALAVRLAGDPAWRAEIRLKIAEGKHRAYRDRACIGALEEWLERVARPGARAIG